MANRMITASTTMTTDPAMMQAVTEGSPLEAIQRTNESLQ